MGGTYSTHGEDEKCVQNFRRKTKHKRIIGVDGRIILK
jgi:hypothetical protein